MNEWLRIHLLLILTYGLFRLGGRGPARSLLRIGQGTLILCFLLPPLVSLLPRRLPPLPVVIREPIAEISAAIRQEMPAVAPRAPAPVDVPREGSFPRIPVRVVWGLGILVALVRLGTGARRVRRLLREGTEIRRIGHVSVLVTEGATIPFSTWLGGRAHVALPLDLVNRPADFRLALRHELQHHRQGDTLWALAVEILGVLSFPNPAFVLWKRRIAELQEFSCDESLVGRKGVTPHEYASCLVRVAETASGSRIVPAGTAGMGADPGNPRHQSFLKRRIHMLFRKDRGGRFGARCLGTALAAIVAAVAYGSPPAADGVAPGKAEVDAAIQRIAERAIDEAIDRHRALSGFVLVGDPGTGRLLAVANRDARRWMKAEGHWALGLRLEPASVIKPIIAAAALETGGTTLGESHDCERGKLVIGDKTYHDWKPFDRLTTAETVIQSSNLCSIKLGRKLGADGIARWLTRFGFGPEGVAAGFPESRTGQVPAPEQLPREHYVATVASGFGQVHVTPLEVLQAYGAIANGGLLMKPLPASAPDSRVRSLRRVLSEANARGLRETLARVLVTGTARNAGSKRYRLGGKTGTAYSAWSWEGDRLGGKANASFVGFGPVDNPRVVIYVSVQDPTDKAGVHGSYHAAPVFTRVAEEVLAHLGVPAER